MQIDAKNKNSESRISWGVILRFNLGFICTLFIGNILENLKYFHSLGNYTLFLLFSIFIHSLLFSMLFLLLILKASPRNCDLSKIFLLICSLWVISFFIITRLTNFNVTYFIFKNFLYITEFSAFIWIFFRLSLGKKIISKKNENTMKNDLFTAIVIIYFLLLPLEIISNYFNYIAILSCFISLYLLNLSSTESKSRFNAYFSLKMKNTIDFELLEIQKREHDFNNFLTNIYGNIELLKDNIENSIKSELSDENLEIIKDIKTVALTAGEIISKNKNMDYNENSCANLSFIINMLGRMIFNQNQYKFSAIIPSNITVAMKRSDISRILSNIFTNSKQSMPSGGEISVITNNGIIEQISPINKHFISIQIQDSGCGIPEESKENLFLPYFTTKEEGSGLGLVNVLAILKKYDGDISISSEVDRGTCVSLTLPIIKKNEAIYNPPQTS